MWPEIDCETTQKVEQLASALKERDLMCAVLNEQSSVAAHTSALSTVIKFASTRKVQNQLLEINQKVTLLQASIIEAQRAQMQQIRDEAERLHISKTELEDAYLSLENQARRLLQELRRS